MATEGAPTVNRVGTDATLVGDGNEAAFNIDHVAQDDHGPLPVSTPEDEDVEFEIWLVHGLTGNREGTWTYTRNKSGEGKVFWPKEFLARDFPNARIISYGYDASFVKLGKSWDESQVPNTKICNYGKSLARAIRNHRKDPKSRRRVPIYFVGHSLGGLVIKSALGVCLEPSADKALVHIAEDTSGILFMGTPHKGSKAANWGTHLSRFLPNFVRNKNKKIMKALHANNIGCEELNDAFMRERDHGRLGHVEIYCFFETKPMRLWEGVGFSVDHIVNEESAVLPGSESEAIDEDHRRMVRFPTDSHAGYKGVKDRLELWRSKLLEPPPAAAGPGAAAAAAAATKGSSVLKPPETDEKEEPKTEENKKKPVVNFGSHNFHGGDFRRGDFRQQHAEGDINNDRARGRKVYNYWGNRKGRDEADSGSEMDLDSDSDDDSTEDEDSEAESEGTAKKDTL